MVDLELSFSFQVLVMLLKKLKMQLNGTRPFQFDEMPTTERVETTQSNANNQATENKMIFHYFTFSKNKLMKNAFQFLIY